MRRAFRLARLVFCAGIAVALAPAGAQEVKRHWGEEKLVNTDRPGSDIEHFVWDAPGPGEMDGREWMCVEKCLGNKDCVAWTYVKPSTIGGKGHCWLKSSVPPAKPAPCCTSGTIGEVDTDRPGSDYTHFTKQGGQQVTALLCRKACFEDAKCMAWTFVKPNTTQGPQGVCWLKTSVPPPAKNGCCMSGYFEIEVVH